MIKFKIIDLTEGSQPTIRKSILGITNIDFDKKIVYFNFISKNPSNISILLRSLSDKAQCAIDFETIKDRLVYDNSCCAYRLRDEVDDGLAAILPLQLGHDKYPYSICREYEAVKHFDEFKGNSFVNDERVINDDAITSKIKYTFGLEFETSMGFIPENECFKNGLIPLRDGSISGTEYSTIVLSTKGTDNGAKLLQQQLLTLREYCHFNKECALHIHMGGYPVAARAIYILHLVEQALEQTMYNFILPDYSFNTAKYKRNGKDYCMRVCDFPNFDSMFEFYTGSKYFGSLEQPHKDDPTREAKWRISTRYFGLNLINMLCYDGPKTVEFRFLRPTFNYRKIRLWLLIFNAVLQYSENLYNKFKKVPSPTIYCQIKEMSINLPGIIDEIYERPLAELIKKDMNILQNVVSLQNVNGDYCGQDIVLEEKLFKDVL